MERIFLKIQMLRFKSIKFYVEIKKIFNFKKSELVYYPWITSIVYFVYISMYIHISIHSFLTISISVMILIVILDI